MRTTSIAFITLFLGLSHAQSSIPGLPECAGGCIGDFGGCGTLDANCICNNDQLIANLACCVSVSCEPADQETTLSFAEGICASYDADLPQSASCAPGAQSTPVGSSTAAASGASSTATASGTSSAPATTASTADSGSSASASASAAVSSASAEASEAIASASESAAAEATGNVGARNGRVESGLGLGLAVAGLIAAI